MAGIIENPKEYTGRELEDIFFRPMLTGPNAVDLGVKIMYNMPVPTTLSYWRGAQDVLRAYAQGWSGGTLSDKYQKTIELSKVKSELGFGASDYFGMIYENITNSSEINMDDLTGTDLEKAEVSLFRESILESIRETMWVGSTDHVTGHNAFNGFLIGILDGNVGPGNMVAYPDMAEDDAAVTLLKKMWKAASPVLKAFKGSGKLVYLVSDDVYSAYEDALNNHELESALAAIQGGRNGLTYNGIPVIDVGLAGILGRYSDVPNSFAVLTHRENLAFAVNTKAFPGSEVRMWYNPDEMENRQRAIFMAGCDILLPELLVFAMPSVPTPTVTLDCTATGGDVSVAIPEALLIDSVKATPMTTGGASAGNEVTLTATAISGTPWTGTIAGTSVAKVKITVTYGSKTLVLTENI